VDEPFGRRIKKHIGRAHTGTAAQPNPWSPTVINFLDHLQDQGFAGSPRTIGSGFDDAGNEKLEYLPGRSPQPAPWTDQGITERFAFACRFFALFLAQAGTESQSQTSKGT